MRAYVNNPVFDFDSLAERNDFLELLNRKCIDYEKFDDVVMISKAGAFSIKVYFRFSFTMFKQIYNAVHNLAHYRVALDAAIARQFEAEQKFGRAVNDRLPNEKVAELYSELLIAERHVRVNSVTRDNAINAAADALFGEG